MASIIPGYEYDIFISYRQKDNKHDGWVTEFVNNLKGELESTFKEEISVYFDINPHDGLLETHDVDASLKEKLKCLVFIPIISRTYCDPKSFAWEHEFKAFVDLASQDDFGLKVKLSNGNVANRILPVRIHELDNDDIKLCESILGGVLRGIELIYKESGFNRPLKPDDDEKNNLNKTKYRNQIAKVAFAIKEIIAGLKKELAIPLLENTSQSKSSENLKKEERRKEHNKPAVLAKRILSGAVILAVIIAMVLIYPKIFNRVKPENIIDPDGRISVAVMPFQNLTNDRVLNIWQNGIKDELINFLSANPKELKIRQTESINTLIQSQNISDYVSITPAVASTISKKLDANVFITGSIKQAGTTIRINAQLYNSKTKEILKSFKMNAASEEEILTDCDSISKMINSFLIISILNKEITPDIQHHASTNSPEALRYYILAMEVILKGDYPTARNWLFRAIDKDPNFFEAIIGLSYAYANPGMYDEAKSWYLKLNEKRDNLTAEQKIWTDNLYEKYFGTPGGQIKCYRQLLEYDDQQPQLYYMMGSNYAILRQYDKAIPEFEKSLEIYKKWDSKPPMVWVYTELGYAYHNTGKYKKEKEIYRKAEKDFPDDLGIIQMQATLSLTEGDVREANNFIEKYKSLANEYSWSQADLETNLAGIYSEAGMFEKAEQYYRQALSSVELTSDNSWYFYQFAWFLIDKDRNIEEGMTLINKVLKVSPDDYSYLDCRGWGLYKQGKHKEALEILQKSWDLRMKNARYNHEAYLHLEEVKKSVAIQK